MKRFFISQNHRVPTGELRGLVKKNPRKSSAANPELTDKPTKPNQIPTKPPAMHRVKKNKQNYRKKSPIYLLRGLATVKVKHCSLALNECQPLTKSLCSPNEK